ncbi:hypothetical protein [Chloroflexus sp.]|uniref:hypothetical protein n=1 Tax=Chloroflexus sp. TaxID=1904827 RepID=UPI002ADDA394|nr:hypothetical protein [Chloroflexus sp.]
MTNQTVQFQGLGRWSGNAEVFDTFGRLLGNGSDYRHVQLIDDERIRIDVSFVGPFKHSGHYFIQQRERYRLYEGPANIGYAEVLSEQVVDVNAYWPALGLSQRLFLMIVDGRLQLSLAHMSRGEYLMYVVVGQNDRVPEHLPNPQPNLISGTHYDLHDDPACGRGEILLHRTGVWRGVLTALDQVGQSLGEFEYTQTLELRSPQSLSMQTAGGAFHTLTCSALFVTNQWQAWTTEDSEVVGSYSLSGGRALSGQFYYRKAHLRCWQREVTTLDGAQKAILQHWYRGGQRIGSQFGVLTFERR